MKDGYYLSAYITIGQLAHIRKLPLRHDQNLSLWSVSGKKVTLLHVWELERVTGLKHHDVSFFDVDHTKAVINTLLEQYHITIDDLQEIWGCPQLKETDYHLPNNTFPLHSLAHLYSGLLYDTNVYRENDILAFAVDGGPDNVLDNAYRYHNHYVGAYTNKGEIKGFFAVESPGLIWEYTKNKFGMPEGSLMALASASQCKLQDSNDIKISIHNMKAYDDVTAYVDEIYDKCCDALAIDSPAFDSNFSLEENRISMAMKVICNTSTRIMCSNIDKAAEKFKFDTAKVILSVTGGFALNCPTNSYLMDKYRFKDFIAPPCVSDTGISIGLALMQFYHCLPDMIFHFDGAYCGNSHVVTNGILDEYKKYIRAVKYNASSEAVAEDLIKSPIIWFDGRAEIGPRALGHRSILGDPRKKETKDKLNIIKKREWWRPVAPVVLADVMDLWFDNIYHTPYMLHVFQVNEKKQAYIPAITHLDNSSRVQTISKEDDKHLYDVINVFYKKTGVPIICNTSLNDKGEPIIDNIHETLNFALRKGFQVVYLNGVRVELMLHSEYLKSMPAKRPVSFERVSLDNVHDLLKQYNPFNLDDDTLCFYYDFRAFLQNVDITMEKDIHLLMKMKQKIGRYYRN